jgi:hypothetical protein
MDTVHIVKVYEDINVTEKLTEALKTGRDIQLDVQSLSVLQEKLSDMLAVTGDLGYKICYLRGPLQYKINSSLFEETVSVASLIEDAFESEIKSITTFKNKKSTHIEELCDFYQFDKRINVEIEPCNCGKIHLDEDPISMTLWIEHMRKVNNCPELYFVYNINKLNQIWFDERILVPLLDYIGEVRVVRSEALLFDFTLLSAYFAYFKTGKFHLCIDI